MEDHQTDDRRLSLEGASASLKKASAHLQRCTRMVKQRFFKPIQFEVSFYMRSMFNLSDSILMNERQDQNYTKQTFSSSFAIPIFTYSSEDVCRKLLETVGHICYVHHNQKLLQNN